MNNKPSIRHLFFSAVAALLLSPTTLAWGPDGHRVIGALAIDQLNEQARTNLYQLMDTDKLEQLVEWCNWPDVYRATDEGAWSEPMHYINMAPGASHYEKQRDCPDGMCLTEAIGEYAVELQNTELPLKRRQQAFAWVCHLVGDMHQPLHAGFGHDRGGTDVDIKFGGEDINVHWFWDGALIAERTESWSSLYEQLQVPNNPPAASDWQKNESVAWTNESHAFADTHSYPDNPVISDEFADQSWVRVQDQLTLGGSRLARVLNTLLSDDTKPKHHSRRCHKSKKQN